MQPQVKNNISNSIVHRFFMRANLKTKENQGKGRSSTNLWTLTSQNDSELIFLFLYMLTVL